MSDATTVLLQYGIAGVAIIAEAGVVLRLYADNKQLQKDKDALQEARRVDAKETTDKVTQPLESISQTVKLMYEKLDGAKKSR
jgi:stalled ribosome rescue protein Dom34